MAEGLNDLPAPLATAECNLRGFQWMPLDVASLPDSEFAIHTTGDEFKAAIVLWCKSWSQVPAGSLPNDDISLKRLSGADNWKRVKAGAMRGWVLCSDNRWYHPVIVAKAMEALPARKAHADNKAAAAERKEREREDRKRLFALLREHGQVPDIHIKTTELRKMAEGLQSQPGSRDVTRDMSHAVTAKTGEDMTGQNRTGQDQSSSVPDGTGGEPPDLHPMVAAGAQLQASARDLTEDEERLLWNAGLAMLLPSYTTGSDKQKDAKARTFVGGLAKRIKEAGLERRVLFDVFQAACVERPVNPETWLSAAVAHRCGKRVRSGQLTDEQRRDADAASDAGAMALIRAAAGKSAANDGVIDAA
jgi:hypothetical protein